MMMRLMATSWYMILRLAGSGSRRSMRTVSMMYRAERINSWMQKPVIWIFSMTL